MWTIRHLSSFGGARVGGGQPSGRLSRNGRRVGTAHQAPNGGRRPPYETLLARNGRGTSADRVTRQSAAESGRYDSAASAGAAFAAFLPRFKLA